MSSDPNTQGGPAFPVSIPGCGDNGWSGMTLRDYFAAKALPHALARARYEIDRYGDKGALDHVPQGAKLAYRIADAMLLARALSSPNQSGAT